MSAEEDRAEGDCFEENLALEVDGGAGVRPGGVRQVVRGINELVDAVWSHGDVERAEGDLQERDIGRCVVEHGGDAPVRK